MGGWTKASDISRGFRPQVEKSPSFLDNDVTLKIFSFYENVTKEKEHFITESSGTCFIILLKDLLLVLQVSEEVQII